MDNHDVRTDADVPSTRRQNDHRNRSYGSNDFVPTNEPTAAPSNTVKYRPAFPQSFTSGPFQAFPNDMQGVENPFGPPHDASQPVQTDVHSSSPVDDEGPWAVQDFGLSRYRSPPHPVAATQPRFYAADDSGEYPRVFPTPTSRRSQGTMLSNPKHGFVNDDFAALGHQFLNQHTGTMTDTSGLHTGITTSEPLFGDVSNPYGTADPYVLGQRRADHSRTLPPYENNAHGVAEGWAYADGNPSPTATFGDHMSNERFQHDDLFHPRAGSSGLHPHFKAAEPDLMMDSPTKMDRGQWWTQPQTARMPLTNTPPHPFAHDNSWKQPRSLSPIDFDRTFSSPPYSGLSLSSPNPQEPVRFLTKNFSNPIVLQDRLMPVTSIDSPLTASPHTMSRRSDTSHHPVDSGEVCPHCCFVSRGKERSDRKSNLRRHIRDKHERAEEAKPMCPEMNCGKTFERSDYVLRHCRKSHGYPTTTEDTSPREE